MLQISTRTLICSALGILATSAPVFSQNAPAVEDPFSAPASVPASPFGDSATPISPFGSALPAPASSTASDPFSAPNNESNATVTSPFEAPPQNDPYANASTTPDPFSAEPNSGSSSTVNPFDAPTAAPVTSPFGDGSAPAQTPQPGAKVFAADENPFAAFGGTENVGSPFGSAQPASPFGGPAAATPSATGNFQPASPFGGESSGPATPPTNDSNPFFSTNAPASPFGGPSDATTAQPGAPAATNNPFASGTGGFSPFSPGTLGGSSAGSGDVNPDGIAQLYAFRFEELTRWDGTKFVNRKRITYDEAKEFDRLAQERYVQLITSRPGFPGYDGTTPPNIWAEWCHYSDQVELWSRYVDEVVLAGTRLDNSTYQEIQWPGGAPDPTQQQGTGLDGQTNIVNYASQTSLDDQTSDLLFGPNPGAGQQQQADSLDPSVMTDQIVKVYNSRLQDLRNLENEQESFYTEFLDRLAERKTQRLAYVDWRNDQERAIEDAVIDWNRRYNGSVANIGGVRYELYRPGAVPDNVQRDSVVVVTEFDLTPFDILNPEDGTLKE
ncbi:MAG: hypothetical protein ACFCU1_04145 [Sumerlaeia bacterium]